MVLANILRTDADVHRAMPADTELAQAIAVLARAQQDAVWDRTQASNKLRSHLREYYPGFLAAVAPLDGVLTSPIARALLAAAPTPEQAAKLTRSQLRAVLKKAGRSRGIDAEADRPIITSFPGLGSLLGARVLAEIGDDRARFTDAKALKAYAGAAPVTRASGKHLAISARKVKNQRLAAVGYLWSFAALTASRGAKAHYDRRREAGDRHTSAQRNLFNRMIGCLHHCLTNQVGYTEQIAFPIIAETTTA